MVIRLMGFNTSNLKQYTFCRCIGSLNKRSIASFVDETRYWSTTLLPPASSLKLCPKLAKK